MAMFDQNFSFVSSSANAALPDHSYSNSTDISPFTSRCSSPQTRDRSASPKRRDSRFDSYRVRRRPSALTALTAQLESHVLSERLRTSESTGPPSPLSEYTYDSVDEGFFDGPSTPATTNSDDSEVDPTFYELSNSSVTSSPRPSLSLEAQALSSYTVRRRQRQALVRLQCLAKRAPDLAMLMEECHPSSLPLGIDLPWNMKSRSNSANGLTDPSSARVEKERMSNSALVRKTPKMKKRITR